MPESSVLLEVNYQIRSQIHINFRSIKVSREYVCIMISSQHFSTSLLIMVPFPAFESLPSQRPEA